jgi:hypothetical protein
MTTAEPGAIPVATPAEFTRTISVSPDAHWMVCPVSSRPRLEVTRAVKVAVSPTRSSAVAGETSTDATVSAGSAGRGEGSPSQAVRARARRRECVETEGAGHGGLRGRGDAWPSPAQTDTALRFPPERAGVPSPSVPPPPRRPRRRRYGAGCTNFRVAALRWMRPGKGPAPAWMPRPRTFGRSASPWESPGVPAPPCSPAVPARLPRRPR